MTHILICVALTAEGCLPLPFFIGVLARDQTSDTLIIELDSVHKVCQIRYSIYRMYPAPIYCIGYYVQSCWTDPDTSVVSLPWPVIMYHIILCIQVQVLLYWVVSGFFLTHPNPLYVTWIIDFYIDQGQGRGLGSSDRTLTRASKNILSNLLHYNRNF